MQNKAIPIQVWRGPEGSRFQPYIKKSHTEFITNKPQYNRLHPGIYCVNDKGRSLG